MPVPVPKQPKDNRYTMTTKTYVLFDLDGTLTDPGEGITNSVAYALERYGITVADRSVLYPFIGPPLAESFERFYGFSEADAKAAVEVYREYFSVQGWAENRVYPGIPALLSDLVEAGKHPILATSKPLVFARRILEHFGLAASFTVIHGSPLHPPKGYGKADVIREALTLAGVTDPATAVMVGDRHHDIDGAKAAGIVSIGVLYGYGDAEELTGAGAEAIAPDVETLRGLLLKQ